jgi:alpha-tubulin suppressor-like RCC1 family protein
MPIERDIDCNNTTLCHLCAACNTDLATAAMVPCICKSEALPFVFSPPQRSIEASPPPQASCISIKFPAHLRPSVSPAAAQSGSVGGAGAGAPGTQSAYNKAPPSSSDLRGSILGAGVPPEFFDAVEPVLDEAWLTKGLFGFCGAWGISAGCERNLFLKEGKIYESYNHDETSLILVEHPKPNLSWIATALGKEDTFALDQEGVLYSWTPGHFSPTTGRRIRQKFTDFFRMLNGLPWRFSTIAAGRRHTLALDSQGHVYSWGSNTKRELGRRTGDFNSPFPIMDLWEVKCKAIAAGEAHSVALMENNQIYSWGDDEKGQLGRPSFPKGSPRPITMAVNPATIFTSLAAGGAHNLVLDSDGNIYSWGSNEHGQLGREGDPKVAQLVSLPGGIKCKAIAAGRYHSLALGVDGKIYSWGYNPNGELARAGDPRFPRVIRSALEGPVRFKEISAGDYHNLALGEDDYFYSWGSNNAGQLAREGRNYEDTPSRINSAPYF